MEASEKYALVTGASSGIGWHISEELAKRGYSIVAVSNQPDRLQDLKTALEQVYAVHIITTDIDLAQEDSPIRVFNFCKENNYTIEVLVNDAGIFFFGEVAKIDYNRVKSIMTLHTFTPALLCRLFGEQMISNGKGYILNISSITAVMPYPGISLYAPTKAFIRHFTLALRTEMKLDGINVTCLIPGATDTSLYSTGNINTSLLKKLGIMKKPETVAKAGINALFRGRAECTPGFVNKIAVFLVPLVPRFIIEVITRRSNIIRKKK
ncbi:MAG: SDR family NAD(P)-dependent oxidoreductase [Bacteroidia bacterium]|nr:SDR family NAD(P)-dependent oxidoreductase [Bacteroidia bacterium]